jgi:hypothetical protein
MYTINGKEYSEVDINKRCAELMALEYNTSDEYVMLDANASGIENICDEEIEYNPCNNPSDTWPIIEKCWDELNQLVSGKQRMEAQWIFTMQTHNCTKLVAACICLIELN